jgi:Ca2+-binding EF-hand superfamily protein
MLRKILLIGAAAVAVAAVPAASASAAMGKSQVSGVVMFWLLDRNGDGTIDKQEIAALRGVVFDALDLNGDGTFTKDEARETFKNVRAHIADRVANVIRNGPAKTIEKRDKAMAVLGLDDADSVARADFISKDTELFAKADKDGDGKISKAEFVAARDAFHGALSTDD